jgi:hypothetical protein
MNKASCKRITDRFCPEFAFVGPRKSDRFESHEALQEQTALGGNE